METLIHLLSYFQFGNKEKMGRLIYYFKSDFQFYQSHLEQTLSTTTTTSNDNHSQLYLDCFSSIC